MKEKTIRMVMTTVFIFGGIALITYYSNWQTAIGVYLLVSGNNAELLNKVVRK